MSRLRGQYDLRPLVIHANYLINVAGGNAEFQRKSIAAFRAEIERAIALMRRLSRPASRARSVEPERAEGLERAAAAIAQAAERLSTWRAPG